MADPFSFAYAIVLCVLMHVHDLDADLLIELHATFGGQLGDAILKILIPIDQCHKIRIIKGACTLL